jgi:hypothetical protein
MVTGNRMRLVFVETRTLTIVKLATATVLKGAVLWCQRESDLAAELPNPTRTTVRRCNASTLSHATSPRKWTLWTQFPSTEY